MTRPAKSGENASPYKCHPLAFTQSNLRRQPLSGVGNRTVRVRFGKRRASCATVAKIHISGCDSCGSYIKTVDMTKSRLAEPIVDEMAAIPLDLWAQKQGYTKLQTNVMQL